MSKTYALVSGDVIVEEWRNKRKPFRFGDKNIYPGDMADDAFFFNHGVYVGTTTRNPVNPETEVGTVQFTFDHPSKTFSRETVVRAMTTTELNANANNNVDRELFQNKAFRALALVIAEEHGITPAQMKNAIIAKYKTL